MERTKNQKDLSRLFNVVVEEVVWNGMPRVKEPLGLWVAIQVAAEERIKEERFLYQDNIVDFETNRRKFGFSD